MGVKAETIMSIRPVKHIIESKPTMEGAGVKLRRAFGFGETAEFDPFLLLDDFRNDRPEDYRAGFPWHPHRGIETITYVLAGTVDHQDSLGNKGALGAGDVQWMTAGSGILHQEMPQGDPRGRMHGFQLWANLPSSLKMTAPRYQDIKAAEIPEVIDDDGTRVRVVCGRLSASLPKRKSMATKLWSASAPEIDRSSSSTAVTRLPSRPVRKAFASCSFRASLSRSRSPGTDPS
jgi:redox-sensitive bicupin YhaK (pirin superfamily)